MPDVLQTPEKRGLQLRLGEADEAAGRRAVSRPDSRPDSPAQVQLSHGSDGQVQADEVAVRLVFVGAEERFSGLEPKTETKPPKYILYLQIF